MINQALQKTCLYFFRNIAAARGDKWVSTLQPYRDVCIELLAYNKLRGWYLTAHHRMEHGLKSLPPMKYVQEKSSFTGKKSFVVLHHYTNQDRRLFISSQKMKQYGLSSVLLAEIVDVACLVNVTL